MKLSNKIIKKTGMGFLVLILMVSIAILRADREIILPEIAAMIAGMWIYEEPSWINNPYKIFFIPSGTAIIGFIINQIKINYSLKIILSATFMMLFLMVTRSTLATSLATGFLPIIVNATEFSFLIAIFITTFIVMMGVLISAGQPKIAAKQPINYLNYFIFLLLLIIWVGFTQLIDHAQMGVIPPVMVTFFEVLNKPKYRFDLLVRQIFALSLAALISWFIFQFTANWLVTVTLALPLIVLMLKFLSLKLPAAFVFPFLIIVLPTNMAQVLPLSTFILATIFLSTTYLLKNQHKNSNG